MQLAIVLVAAGASTRMGFDKVWADLDGEPLLARAVASARSLQPAELILVVSAERLADAARLAPEATIVSGGPRRRDSVAAGLAASRAAWLAIHDGARALAPPELFQRGLDAAQPTGAAVPGIPLKDTIKRVAASRVVGTPVRAEHVAVQTPQVFRRDLLLRALAMTDDDVTDEAILVERLGIEVAVFVGDERAFKITTPLDFALAGAVLSDSRHVR
ncbi:MAG: 2-C-methyl-D-erythritol 4-phosphate cytidylyltransferase [Chloroflexota bacterium]|nr:2-C-methyl-D-erythritol 4-phosphate cytidylyltransferase [Chloroflexota bacterium]